MGGSSSVSETGASASIDAPNQTTLQNIPAPENQKLFGQQANLTVNKDVAPQFQQNQQQQLEAVKGLNGLGVTANDLMKTVATHQDYLKNEADKFDNINGQLQGLNQVLETQNSTLQEIEKDIQTAPPDQRQHLVDEYNKLVGQAQEKSKEYDLLSQEAEKTHNNIQAAHGRIEAMDAGIRQFTKEKDVPYLRNAVMRGYLQSKNAITMLKENPTAEDIQDFVNNQKELEQYPGAEEYNKFTGAKDASEAWKAFKENPLKVVSELSAESLSGLITFGAGSGSGLGFLINPVAGMAMTSLGQSYGSKIIELMQKNGVDLTNKESVKNALAHKETMSDIREEAIEYGIPVAAIDAISMGLAGKFGVKIATKFGGKFVGNLAGGVSEIATQGALGAAGETAGQLTAGEKLDMPSIMAEAFGELGGSAGELTRAANKMIEAHVEQAKIELKDKYESPEFIYKNIYDGNIAGFKEDVDDHVKQGNFTPQEAESMKQTADMLQEVDNTIPNNIASFNQRQKSVQLITERNAIQQEMIGKEPILTQPMGKRIADINEELGKIAGTPSPVSKEGETKTKPDATEKRKQPENNQQKRKDGGEGRKATKTGGSDSTVESGQEQQVGNDEEKVLEDEVADLTFKQENGVATPEEETRLKELKPDAKPAEPVKETPMPENKTEPEQAVEKEEVKEEKPAEKKEEKPVDDKPTLDYLDDSVKLMKTHYKDNLEGALKKYKAVVAKANVAMRANKITEDTRDKYLKKMNDILGERNVDINDIDMADSRKLEKQIENDQKPDNIEVSREKLLKGIDKAVEQTKKVLTPKAVKIAKEKGMNVQKMGVDVDSLIDLAGRIAKKSVNAGADVAIAIRDAVDLIKKHPVYQKLKKEGALDEIQFETDFRTSMDLDIRSFETSKEEKPKTGEKKKSLLTRVHSASTDKDVKAAIEKHGLTRKVETHEEAKKKAKEFIKDVGFDDALYAIRSGNLKGAPAAFVWHTLTEDVFVKMQQEQGEAKKDILREQYAALKNEFSNEATFGGQFNSMLHDIYTNSEQYTSEVQEKEWKDTHDGEAAPESYVKNWKEWEQEIKDLKVKIAEAEERAKKAEEDLAFANIKEEAKREKKIPEREKKIKEAAKKLSAKIRAGKIQKPGVFMSASPASLVWDGALEVVATTLDKTADIAQAVADGWEHIKNSEWYKNSNEDVQDQAYDGWHESYSEHLTSDADTGKIKIPGGMVKELVEGGIDNITDLTKAVKEALKDEYLNATDRDIRDAITGYGKTINMSQEQIDVDIRKMRRVGKVISAIEDVQGKKRPMRSGLQRDKLDAEERLLQKQLKELLKDLPVDEADAEKRFKSALDAVKTRLQNSIEDLERRIQTGEKPPVKKSIQYDQEANALKEQRDNLKKIVEALEGKTEPTDEQRLEQAKKSVERSIEEYQRRIKENELETPKGKPVPNTPELQAMKAARDVLKTELDKLKEAAGIPEKQRLEQAKKNAQKRIAELEDRISTKNFAPKVKKAPVIADSELNTLNAEKLKVQDKFDKLKYQEELKNRTSAEKALDVFRELTSALPRVLVASLDFSAVLAQGLKRTITSPLQTKYALKEMFKQFGSEQYADEWLNKVKAQEWYPELKKSGMFLSEMDGKISAKEELFISGWINKIWDIVGKPIDFVSKEAYQKWTKANLYKATQRAYDGYLNAMRVKGFLEGKKYLNEKGKTIDSHPEEFKSWSDYINNATGRGSLGKLENDGKLLQTIFFSPKKLMSDINLNSPWAAMYYARMSPEARKLALINFAQFLGVAGTVVALGASAGADVEDDSKSADFMKLKFGNTRINPWGGMQSMAVLMSRLLTGQTKSSVSGKVKNLGEGYKPDTRLDVLSNYFKNRLAPVPSMSVKLLDSNVEKGDGGETTRVDQFGNPITLSDETINAMRPMWMQSMKELYQDKPAVAATVLQGLAIFGGSVQTYGAPERKKENKGFVPVK